MKLDIKVAALRCPFCLDEIDPKDPSKSACTRCMGWMHDGCWVEHGRCVACGAVSLQAARGAAPEETQGCASCGAPFEGALASFCQACGSEEIFCDRCVATHLTTAHCADCTQLLVDAGTTEADLAVALGATLRFCSAACAARHRVRRLCAGCGQRLGVASFRNDELRTASGEPLRFCQEACLERRLCGHCQGPLRGDGTLVRAAGVDRRVCGEACARAARAATECAGCGGALGRRAFVSELRGPSGPAPRFCKEACLAAYEQRRVCATCDAAPGGELGCADPAIDAAFGVSRFCGEACRATFRAEHLCAACTRALSSRYRYCPDCGDPPRYCDACFGAHRCRP